MDEDGSGVGQNLTKNNQITMSIKNLMRDGMLTPRNMLNLNMLMHYTKQNYRRPF